MLYCFTDEDGNDQSIMYSTYEECEKAAVAHVRGQGYTQVVSKLVPVARIVAGKVTVEKFAEEEA